jgi:predicted transcriptional regulator
MTQLKALAHPARLAILQYLAETKVCNTGDISDELPLSRTTVKQHLTELKNAGCVSGALQMENYFGIIEKTGFNNITLHKQKSITIPDDALKKYLTSAEFGEFKRCGTGIYSITVSANKN